MASAGIVPQKNTNTNVLVFKLPQTIVIGRF